MGHHDISEKYQVIKRGLIKLGLEYSHAKKHDVAECSKTGHKTTIPRHKSKTLNKFTVGSICDFLIQCGYTVDEIKDAFRWKK